MITIRKLAIKNNVSESTIRNYIERGIISFRMCECNKNLMVPDIMLPLVKRGRTPGSKNRKKVVDAAN